MTLFKIAAQSVRKQKFKKIALILAIAVSFLTILLLISYTTQQKADIESQFDEYGANIIITPKTNSLSLTYGGINLNGIVTEINEIKLNQLEKIKTIPNAANLRAVSPKLIGTGSITVNGNRKDVLIIGVDFEAEKLIKNWWQIFGTYPQSENEIIIGSETASKLDLEIGDKITIKETQLLISGILSPTGSQDDEAIFAKMETTQTLLGRKDSVSLVEVSALCTDCPIDSIVDQISTVLPGTKVNSISQAMQQKMEIVNNFSRFTSIISIVLILMCGFLVFMTVSASVSDRKKEIGIFRAIGFGKYAIIQIIMYETLFLAVSGAIIGAVITPLAALLISRFSELNTISPSTELLLIGALSVVLLTAFSGLFPAIKASRTNPVDAMNSL